MDRNYPFFIHSLVLVLLVFFAQDMFAKKAPTKIPCVNQLTVEQKKQVIRFVKKAAAHAKQHGIQRASQDFLNKKGPFIQEDLYVFVIDNHFYSLANGGRPEIVGKDLKKLAITQESATQIYKLAKKGGGWISYYWLDPKTNRLACKSSWVTPFIQEKQSSKKYTLGAGLQHP